MKLSIFSIVAIVIAIAAFSFTKPSHKTTGNYFFETLDNGSSYQPVTLINGNTPPVVGICQGLTSTKCSGGFDIDTKVSITHPDGTHTTFTPVGSPDVDDFKVQ